MNKKPSSTRKGDKYLSSSAMRATSSSMALASSVLGFDIIEIWSEVEPGNLHCTYVHAEDRIKERFPGVITGHYPLHKREHKLSPKLCELAKKSTNRCHWRILDLPSLAGADLAHVYDQLAFPLKTEMAYQLEVEPEYGYNNAASSFIVAFSVEEVQFKPSKLKFLSGLAVAIFVAAFDLDEEPAENEGSKELDVKKFEPTRPYNSSTNLAAMDVEVPSTLPTIPELDLSQVKRSETAGSLALNVSQSESEPSARDGEDTPRFAHQREGTVPVMTLHAPVPTWAPASPFSFPIAEIPVKYPIYDNLTFSSFTEIKHIADGSNAHVFLAKLHGENVIIKMIKEGVESDPVAIQEFDLEYGTLARIMHTHIIRVLGAGKLPRRFIVLEYLSGGSLNTMLMQNQYNSNSTLTQKLFRKPTFTYSNLLQTARAMAEALDYLHCRCHLGATIIHRDLKPDNIGFTKEGCLKLFDFGLVTCVRARSSPDDAYEMTGYTGSLRYMAPEVVLRKPYTEKADVYSFSIMLWQMARDRVPFKGYNKEEFIRQVVHQHERPKLDKSWPVGFSNLLKSCWEYDPKKRPPFSTILIELGRLLAQQTGMVVGSSPPPTMPNIAGGNETEEKKKGRMISMSDKSASTSSWF